MNLPKEEKKLSEIKFNTEKVLQELAKQIKRLEDSLGGSLKDISYDVLPGCLEKYYQIEAKRLTEKSFLHNGRKIDFSIYGKGIDKTTDKKLSIIGEVKYRITLTEVKKFIRKLNLARNFIREEIFPLLFGYRIRLDARELAKVNHIRMFVTYGKEIM